MTYLREAVLAALDGSTHGRRTSEIVKALDLLPEYGGTAIVDGIALDLESDGLIENARVIEAQGSPHLWRLARR